jgi:deoxyadenosine/deoxycytidine kinase
MNWIEIMGPSGIGKSTLLKSLSKIRQCKNDWVFLNEGLQELAINNANETSINKILKIYLSQSLLNRSKNLVVNSLLNRKNAYLKDAYRYSPLIESYINYHVNISTNNAVEKAYRISLYKSIIEQLCIFDYYNYTKLVLLDEGPLNHHPDLAITDWSKDQTLPNGIVFCHLDPNENFKRIKSRQKKGRLVPLHKGLTDTELKEFIIQSNFDYLEKRKLLISKDIPYIDLDLKLIDITDLNDIMAFLMKCQENKEV